MPSNASRQTAARAAATNKTLPRSASNRQTVVRQEVTDISDLPDDVGVLKQTIMELLAALNALAASNAKLQERLDYLVRRHQGRQSEKCDPAQLGLFAKEIAALLGEHQASQGQDNDRPDTEPKQKSKRNSNGHGRRQLPDHLPRTTVAHFLDDEMLACPECQTDRVIIGTKTSEQLEIIPAKLIVIRHVEHTYACPCCGNSIETATKPSGAIAKCLAGPGLLAHVIVNKFDDHLPLYRQEEILKRNEFEISRSTMCGWILGCATALEPLYKLMHNRIMRSRVIQTDGTTLPLIDPGRGSTRASGFWVYRGDDRAPYVAYDFTPAQDRTGPVRWLQGFNGTLQADASSLYDVFFDKSRFGTDVVEAGCWAHARRHFEKAKLQHPGEALTAMAFIVKLYEVEKDTRAVGRRKRRRRRRAESRRVLDAFDQWLRSIEPKALPKSPMGRAVRYVRRHWKALSRFIDNGRLSIDNNATERNIRPMAIGRKNWLFAGSDDGGRATAVMFTMVESAKQCGVDATAWLADVLARIATTAESELEDLLPDRWKLLAENPAVRQIRSAAKRRAAFHARRQVATS